VSKACTARRTALRVLPSVLLLLRVLLVHFA
jgi:hypothetical protein